MTPADATGAAVWLSARTQVSVSSWEDQVGANDAAQATAGNQPTSTTYHGSPCLTFDGSNDYMSNPVSMADGAKWLAVSFKLNAVPGASSFKSLVRMLGSSGKFVELLAMNFGGYKSLSFLADFSAAGGSAVGVDLPLDLAPHVVIVQYLGGTNTNPDQYHLWVDGTWRTPRASSTINAEASAIGAIGGRATSVPATSSNASVSMFDVSAGLGTLTHRDADRIAAQLLRGQGRRSTLGPQIVCDGNSLTYGFGAGYLDASGYLNGYPYQLATTKLGGESRWNLVNLGVNGQTTAQMVTDFDSQVAPLYNPLRPRNVLVCWEIGNHIYGGATADDAMGSVIDYCERGRRTGFEVLVANCSARSDITAGVETIRTTVNTYLSATWSSFADGLIDFDGDARLVTPLTDGVHFDATQYGYVAEDVHTVLARMLGKAYVPA
jgi:lysophospholipase L1-like esterase